jgi:hypothetical protein
VRFNDHICWLARTGTATDWLSLSRIVSLLIVGCLLVRAVPVNPGENVGNGWSSAGRRMFFGETPLLGTIVGHQRPLPPEMVGCANCHSEGSGSISTRSFAPRLDRAGMIAPRGRRGGPPSRFSAVSFCRLLRTGVDPAYIVINRQMPRYMLDDGQCLDLWQYLMEEGDEGRKGKQ